MSVVGVGEELLFLKYSRYKEHILKMYKQSP